MSIQGFHSRPLALALLAPFVLAPLAAAGTEHPNVLLITLDDVGQDALLAYDANAKARTPTLDALAATGVKFTRAYSNPMCSPTRAMLMTGRYAFRTGFGYLASGDLAPAEVALPELLKSSVPGATYACGAFGKWHLAHGSDGCDPVDQGFDVFAGHMANPSDHFNWDFVEAGSGCPATFTSTPLAASVPGDYATFNAPVVRDEAVQWINAQTTPFFAYVNFHPPHGRFMVPPQASVSAATWTDITTLGFAAGDNLTGTPDAPLAYQWMIEATDTEIGLLLAGIDPDALEKTVVLVISDNGTPNPMLPAPLQGHGKGTVYERGVCVPLIAWGLGVDPNGASCDGLVGAVDVWSTIAEITGATLPPAVTIDGVSFAPLLANPAAPSARVRAFSQMFLPNGAYVPSPTTPPAVTTHLRAMTDGRFKYLRLFENGVLTEEAYDLSVDANESNDLMLNFGSLPAADQAAILLLERKLIGLSGI